MIGILIKNNGRTLFTGLPKETEKLEKQLAGIGLNIPLKAINLSNHNDIGYEVQIFAQDKLDNEIASRIILHDNIGQLNDVLTYVSKRNADEMYDRICESSAETISELYRELIAPPKIDNNHAIELQTVKAPITESEKRLLDTISRLADRIATFAHLGYKDFTIDDVLKEIDCDFEDIKGMIRDSAAELLRAKPDISSVEVSSLDTPFQPELTVTTEETQDTTADNEEIGGLSL
ncbi:MAG: hypothetical protein IKH96_06995 [Ruminococcus sp.]|uniref:hypothetical protein n=1 Tax=Ruminococcus sp. TaxID=41978 RepID=UPI0025FB7595|nr:hypothetical protein [Ruminococcus sp.]MBR6995752.1 hypothetical protein [Ruminococcus sp.]